MSPLVAFSNGPKSNSYHRGSVDKMASRADGGSHPPFPSAPWSQAGHMVRESDPRPDEDAMELNDDDGRPRRDGRGRLRIYLAAAAGAGKTYAMLNEGH